jgi:thymidylate kinase
MPFIAFLGCDGSGKSAVIQGVAARLVADCHQITFGHWRPTPFASSSNHTHNAADPHGQQARGLISSILKLGWLWFNWWLAWFKYLRRDSRNGFVLFDRYHGDLLVDPKRYRYGGPAWLARIACRMMPQPELVVFLDAPPDVLLSRKQEVGKAALELARCSYLNFCHNLPSCRIIDASQPLESVITEAAAATTRTI